MALINRSRFRFQPLPELVVRERLYQIAQLEGVTVLDAGVDGILHLSKGDMRKCLNIMQSASMFSPSIDEASVYATVGAPPPSVVSATVHVLFNQPLNEAVDHVQALMTTSGVAVQDLITELHGFVVRMKLPPKVMLYMLVRYSGAPCFKFLRSMLQHQLSEMEIRASGAGSDRVQVHAIRRYVSCLVVVVDDIFRLLLSLACFRSRGT
jgi:DNA polymerase III delta prime subunit